MDREIEATTGCDLESAARGRGLVLTWPFPGGKLSRLPTPGLTPHSGGGRQVTSGLIKSARSGTQAGDLGGGRTTSEPSKKVWEKPAERKRNAENPQSSCVGRKRGRSAFCSTTRVTWLLEASSLSHTFRSLWLSGPLHPPSVLCGRRPGPSTRAVVSSVSRGDPLAPPSNGLRPWRRLRHRGRDFRPRASLDLGTEALPGT